MSEYQQKDNTGVIFKNDKRNGENDPNGKGTIMVDGVEYWLSAWTNTDKNGNKYQKVSVQPKEAKAYTPKQENELQAGGYAKPSGGERDDDFQDDIPF